jgi:hypothetical protein
LSSFAGRKLSTPTSFPFEKLFALAFEPVALTSKHDDPGTVDEPIDKSGGGGAVPRAYHPETCMVLRRTGTMQDLTVSHSHSFDEYLLFLGTNLEDQFDLGGEVEL